MSGEKQLTARIDKVIRGIETLLIDLEMLRDDLRIAVAESRVSKNEEKARNLESISASLGKTYEVLKAFYTQLSLLRLKYS